MAEKRNRHLVSATALQAKNKELVQALDTSRRDVRELFQENLSLKKERQQLLEQVANLESRLSQLLTVHSTQETLVKVLETIETNVSHARSLIVTPAHSSTTSSFSFSPSHLSPPSHHSTLLLLPQAMETDQSDQLPPTAHCDPVYTMSSSSIQQENSHLSTITESAVRPKRACTSLIQSYQEPCLHGKLKRDESLIENTTWTNNDSHRVRKSKTNKGSRKTAITTTQAGLRDITNKMK